jgi:hypothetical protein
MINRQGLLHPLYLARMPAPDGDAASQAPFQNQESLAGTYRQLPERTGQIRQAQATQAAMCFQLVPTSRRPQPTVEQFERLLQLNDRSTTHRDGASPVTAGLREYYQWDSMSHRWEEIHIAVRPCDFVAISSSASPGSHHAKEPTRARGDSGSPISTSWTAIAVG